MLAGSFLVAVNGEAYMLSPYVLGAVIAVGFFLGMLLGFVKGRR